MKTKAEINKLFLDTVRSASNAAVQACYTAYCNESNLLSHYNIFDNTFSSSYKAVYEEHVQPARDNKTCEYTDHGPGCTPEKEKTCPIFALGGNFERMSFRIIPPIASNDISKNYNDDARMNDGRLIDAYCRSRYVFMRSSIVYGPLATGCYALHKSFSNDFLTSTVFGYIMLGVTMAVGIANIVSGTTFACKAYQIHNRTNGVCADLKEVYGLEK